MPRTIEPLAWDSDFFGFAIGRVDLDDATEDELVQVVADASDLGLRCLYGSLDPTRPGHAAYHVQSAGFRLVESAVLLERPAGAFTAPPSPSVVREGTIEDLPLLQDAIAVLSPWSRFGADPMFGHEAARRMFQAWVERAARDHQRLLTIAEDESGVTGVATQLRGEPDRIDLMGVTKPGTGANRVLMEAFLNWAGFAAVLAGPCAARNMAVLRFLERDGFRVCRAQYHYHLWLDGGSAASG